MARTHSRFSGCWEIVDVDEPGVTGVDVMEWIERRAGLIGIGAIVVAALALGVAVADHGTHAHDRMLRIAAPGLGERFGGAPFNSGPAPRRLEGGPQQLPFGAGPQLRQFEVAPGPGLRGFAGVGPLHGELTMPGAKGKYETVEVQRGTVTKIADGQLTVRSDDGFTKTYAVPATLLHGIKTGDQVQLRATVANGKATITGLRIAPQMMR